MAWLRRKTAPPSPGQGAALPEGRLAIIAGSGSLPVQLFAAYPDAMVICFEGAVCDLPEEVIERHRYEKMGAVFKALRAGGVTHLVMAGAITRPDLDMKQMDMTVAALIPRILKEIKSGRDDALLRLVIGLFEDKGIAVLGAHDLLPSLTARPGLLAGSPLDAQAEADRDRALEILGGLSPFDVGQGCVVAKGMCLGIETAQGTASLLDYVATTPDRLHRAPGVFCKIPKRDQDLRVDMPTIGPDTLRAAAAAGLGAVVIAAGKVLLVEGESLPALAEDLGLTLYAQEV